MKRKKKKVYADSRGVSMDDATYEKIKKEAAKRDLSFSAYMRWTARHCLTCKDAKREE